MTLSPPRWHVTIQDLETEEDNHLSRAALDVEKFSEQQPCTVTVKKNIRTTSHSHFQDVRLLQFHCSNITYEPGDVLLVQPQNSDENVKHFFEIVSETPHSKLDPSSVIHVHERSLDAPVPLVLQHPVMLRTCVKQYWDLNIVPHRYFFQLLSHFTPSELEKEKLEEFISSEGQEELFNYCNRPRRTVLEVLADFPHAAVNIPLEYLFELLRPIKPRSFSIASSPSGHKNELHLLVAVVKYKTKLVLPRVGLCSTWMTSLSEECSVPVWIKKGSFHFPSLLVAPLIMIGPGTGVAPFRSFIHEQVALNHATADMLYLFFGCRNSEGDFHCQDEWLALQKCKYLTMFCAFSRDQEKKIYVQHIMKEQSSLLWTLLSSLNAAVYIAGRSDGMPAAVKDVLVNDVAGGCGNLSAVEANKWFEQLETSGRYQVETWS